MTTVSSNEFEHTFKSLYKPLCLYSLGYIEQLDEAEDIVQQAFADVWVKIQGGASIANLKAYLYQAVRNRSLSFLSCSPSATATDQLPDIEDTSEEDRIREAEQHVRLWEAIDRLPAGRKQIFLLCKRDGLSYQEIAQELHISIKTVENQLAKAIKTLRETAIRIYLFFFG